MSPSRPRLLSSRRTVLCGIPLLLERKRIKRLYLRVKPPHGEVVVSAPTALPEAQIEQFVRTRLAWIERAREQIRSSTAARPTEYADGDSIPVFGSPCRLSVVKTDRTEQVSRTGDVLQLSVKPTADSARRAALIDAWYRAELKRQISLLLPRLELLTSLSPTAWQIKRMKTRWGSCNPQAGRIWISLALAEKPIPCLEYVLLHELIHLRVPNHGADFIGQMNRYLPDWRERRRLLNET